ncbi:ARM repeat-containing protein [Amniculicola lignicola CBS 123094]|uniref:ARM repeat-containing protein n=1 Tax=Amniculicola lignicola CBS 123094 TaxID=1392246 RepID=A0A6A5W6R6_9PLEO|nr:ARM repeat-containing protein [Amniculicola lignicola CBS 123094]
MSSARPTPKGGKPFRANGSAPVVSDKVSFTEAFDKTLYDNNGDKYDGYDRSIAVQQDDDDDEVGELNGRRLVPQYTATRDQIDEYAHGDTAEADILTTREQQAQIASRETEYQRRRFDRALSPEGTTYQETMKIREIEREEARVQKILEDRERKGDEVLDHVPTLKDGAVAGDKTPPVDKNLKRSRRGRWDSAEGAGQDGGKEIEGGKEDTQMAEPAAGSELVRKRKKRSRWDDEAAAASEDAATPALQAALPAGPPKRTRWDTAAVNSTAAIVPPAIADANAANSVGAVTKPTVIFVKQFAAGGAYMPDEYLDWFLPGEPKYRVLEPPPGREYSHRPAGGPDLPVGYAGFLIPEVDGSAMSMVNQLPTDIPGVGDLQFFKEEDKKYFGKLVDGADEAELSHEELRERKIMRLLLKIKNGTPPMRKTALRQVTDNARQFGPAALFNQILPLLMERTLEDQERHLLVKVVDRILYKLGDLVRPFTHKILVVIEPLLIDQDYYARVEGREIISNLSKAAGLAHMISTMRPDLDHADEYVRNTTARAFAVVAQALGIPVLIPFLRAVVRSRKSWHARHTGVKIVQQIAILMGCAVLPHLKALVECIKDNIEDEQPKVRMVTALSLAALAEASSPYGMESFEPICNTLWNGCRKNRGKTLASFLKAVGQIIQLMDQEWSGYYTSQIMEIIVREFQSQDEEMKKVTLKVVSQCSQTDGVTSTYLKANVLPDFLKAFWTRRVALDKRMYKQVVETIVDLSAKTNAEPIIEKLVKILKDDSEPYRRMCVEAIDKILKGSGAYDIDSDTENLMVDGVLFCFREQTVEDPIIIEGFAAILQAIGERSNPYFPQIVEVILNRLNNKNPSVRQQAADLVAVIANPMSQVGEDEYLVRIAQVLYEYLGEEYPEVLGSILGALRAIVAVVGLQGMQPPIRDVLPRLTPILRNRHEKVQENVIDLVGRIADRGPELVNAREWMRICFELLDMLKAHKKGIRRAANNTFGYIAKAIGPQDVLATLLSNLRTQERQSRVCTAVAIGIIAEQCSPFTVLPALMNEYRVPELNVQNGVLKSMSFMFEYIGDMSRDYVYAVISLLEDALTDRDQVHRQTAASVVKHLALGVSGLDCEDGMLHLLNLVWPNIFETSPHVIDRVIEAIDGLRNALGTAIILNYVMAGLFHPARKVRNPFWRVYNDAYVQQADSMVPCYPMFDDPAERRHELDIFI